MIFLAFREPHNAISSYHFNVFRNTLTYLGKGAVPLTANIEELPLLCRLILAEMNK